MSSFDTVETAKAEGWFDHIPKENNNLQVALLGDSGVGKTTYLNRIAKGKYVSGENPTKFINSEKIVVFDGKPEIEIHDFSGKIVECVTRPSEYIKDMSAVFIFFETNNVITGDNAIFKWFKLVKQSVSPQTPITFIGTKNDDMPVTCRAIKICGVEYPTFFISSKTGKDVEMPFFKFYEHIKT